MKNYVGIDWSSQYDDICIINEMGKTVKEFRIGINKDGFDLLLENLKDLNCKKSDIFIGIETDKDIVAEYLICKGYTVYSLNPLCVHRFKQVFSPEAKKDDKFDAFSLCSMLLKNRENFNPVTKSSKECEELIVHIDSRRMIVKERTRLIQQLRSALSLYLPVFCEFFNAFDTSVPLNLLKIINNREQFKNISFEKYLELIKDVKYMSSKRKERLFKMLKEKTIELNSPTENSLSFRVEMFVEQILLLNENLKKLDKKIDEIYNHHKLAKVFSSLPSAGNVLAPRLLANFGDNKEKFDSYQSVQCYAGTAPVTEKSGKSLSNVKMRKACNKSFRNTLQQFSFCSLKTEPWAKEYYDNLRAKGKNHSSAIRSLANKWLKIIFRMWKKNEEYDSTIFTDKRNEYLKKGEKS